MKEEPIVFNEKDLKKRHDMLLENKKELLKYKIELESDLKKNLNLYDELDQKLIKLNHNIENVNENLQKIINENENYDIDENGNKIGIINSEDLRKKCNECFDGFLIDPSNSKGELLFEISFGKIVITKQITNHKLTFLELKIDTKNQFDREEDEFFFIDENNRIFLDDMNVKKSLFPLNKIVVKNTIPRISVKDLFNGEIEDNHQPSENSEADTDAFNSNNNKNLSFIEKVKKNFKIYKYFFANIFIYTLFIIFWVLSCISFRELNNYALISSTVNKHFFNPGESNVYF